MYKIIQSFRLRRVICLKNKIKIIIIIIKSRLARDFRRGDKGRPAHTTQCL